MHVCLQLSQFIIPEMFLSCVLDLLFQGFFYICCFDHFEKCILRPQVNVFHQSGMMFSVIDSKMGSYPSECIEQFVSLALRCCQDETEQRPSMTEVVRELENIWRMTPEADTAPSESITTNPEKTTTPLISASTSANPFVSSDVSGSNLVSGVIPTIAPRWCFYRYSCMLFKLASMNMFTCYTIYNLLLGL